VPTPLEALLTNPWGVLERLLDGPLHPGGRAATETLLDRVGVEGGTRLLDIGCGAGEALQLARERDARAIGFDRRPSGVDGIRGDLSSLPFRAESFDVVLGECVLCLSADLARTLDEIVCIVKPGGRLAVSDVTVSGAPPDLPTPIDELLCLDGPRERDALVRQISHAGFAIDDVRTHHDDLLEMRDRLRAVLDYERLLDTLGSRGNRLRDGAHELETAVESGRIGYVSVVATRIS
jgi:arsenite methyltransferase